MPATGTPRRSRRTVRPERADVRERVLSAGRAVFGEVGYQKATLDAIAGRAGFSKGAVYSNFAGKDDLFLTLLQHEVAEMRDALALALDDGSLEDDLRLLAADGARLGPGRAGAAGLRRVQGARRARPGPRAAYGGGARGARRVDRRAARRSGGGPGRRG